MFSRKNKISIAQVVDELAQHSLAGLHFQAEAESDYRIHAQNSGTKPECFIWEVLFLKCASDIHALATAAAAKSIKKDEFLRLDKLLLERLTATLNEQSIRRSIYEDQLSVVLSIALTEYSSAFFRSTSVESGTSAMCGVFSRRCSGRDDDPVLLRQARGMIETLRMQIHVYLKSCRFVD